MYDYPCRKSDALNHKKCFDMSWSFEYKEIHTNAKYMVLMAKTYKKKNETLFCQIPFCHTVEGESLGAIIEIENTYEPRCKYEKCKELDDVLALDDIDFTNGRIAEVILAAQLLVDENIEVIVNVSGPLTILYSLISPVKLFKGYRQSPEKVCAVFKKINDNIVEYVQVLKKSGVSKISFADPTASLPILGPERLKRHLKEVHKPLLRSLMAEFGDKGVIILCPKITYGLIGFGEGRLVEISSTMSGLISRGCVNENHKHEEGQTLIID